ncbi:MAG TPA: helix-turn-helix domain-containing protein [Acidimicrobiales bacterium]|nr:helix-turn-helix domain-containing protein [Acidimicrobiales bacterium]
MGATAGTASDKGAAERRSLSDEEFSAAVAAVTSAFGDPTRRQIYLFVRDSEGVTASQVAARFDLHPNVARHHLDKLAAGGYLDVCVERASGAGRPSKHYRASGRDMGLELASRRGDLLEMLLGRALDLLDPEQAECMAELVGEEYGAALAAQMAPGEGGRSLRAALQTVAQALTAHGFAARAEARQGAEAVVAERCPFGEVAIQHPVVCAVDRGMVKGMLAGLYGESIPVTISSRARGDDACTTLV